MLTTLSIRSVFQFRLKTYSIHKSYLPQTATADTLHNAFTDYLTDASCSKFLFISTTVMWEY